MVIKMTLSAYPNNLERFRVIGMMPFGLAFSAADSARARTYNFPGSHGVVDGYRGVASLWVLFSVFLNRVFESLGLSVPGHSRKISLSVCRLRKVFLSSFLGRFFSGLGLCIRRRIESICLFLLIGKWATSPEFVRSRSLFWGFERGTSALFAFVLVTIPNMTARLNLSVETIKRFFFTAAITDFHFTNLFYFYSTILRMRSKGVHRE